MRGAAKRVAVETAGWILVVAGIAALVLPGPGLLMLAGGLAILSQQYEWAERRMRPVELRAKKAAADGVQTMPRIVMSTLFSLGLVALGVLWILDPAAPSWWPVRESWWLIGGWATGSTLIASGVIALALIVWSIKQFRRVDDPQAEAERLSRP